MKKMVEMAVISDKIIQEFQNSKIQELNFIMVMEFHVQKKTELNIYSHKASVVYPKLAFFTRKTL